MDIITENKVKLIQWLSGEEIQHVHSQKLITSVEYTKIRSIQDPIVKITDLLDIILNKGQSSCITFLELLKKDEVNESRPELRDWITTVNTSGLPLPPTYFKQPQKLEQYDMSGDWRGFALIINNVDFSPVSDLKNRHGSEIDEESLVAVFQWLGFEIVKRKNCTRESMLKALDELRMRDHSQADCVVCCVMTHGFKGGVYGVDGEEVWLREVLEKLDNHHCPTLIQKPKLFFIQACQGHHRQSDGSTNTSDTKPVRADYLVAMATIPGYRSFRHTIKGALFIQSLCKNLQLFVPSGIDLLSILTEVNKEVSNMSISSGTMKQMPQPEFTLTKRLVFPIPKTPLPSRSSLS